MNETVRIEDLKIGMFVVLPLSWFRHPFLRNEFLITSRDQIDKIAACGIREIVVDTSRGTSFQEPTAPDLPPAEPAKIPPQTPAKTWTPEKLIPPELREAIDDKSLAPEKKSKIVYDCSRLLVERLFEDPKAENIREAKEGISEIVDLILSDDATSKGLLRITSYDFATYTHSVNVGVFSIMLSKALFRGSDAHDMHELGAGFFLHDIGKVRIDPGIINKPGKVTAEEMAIIMTHPSRGYELLRETSQLTEECMIIVMQHHERQDGSGYPRRLKEEKIHTYSRICCIADVFDALTAERSYKKRLDTFSALKLMREEMLSHFRRDIFEKFVLLFA